MPTQLTHPVLTALLGASFGVLMLAGGCSGGGASGDDNGPVAGPTPPPTPPPPSPTPPPPPPPPPTGAFATEAGTSRFLTQATFGPSAEDVSALTGTSASDWFLAELGKPASLHTPQLVAYRAMIADPDEDFPLLAVQSSTFSFWRNAIEGEDQLRQRMAFALSQILVVSNFGGELLTDIPEPVVGYQDVLVEGAFGNYRDLLEAVTYSPAMGFYLTYMGNQKADPATGRMPDENYAREILQLFTLGVVQLGSDGEPVLENGRPVELYSNKDITGLARVFTGLDLDGLDRQRFPSVVDAVDEWEDLEDALLRPMAVNQDRHSPEAKRFLNCDIAAGTPTESSIDQALDCIMAHPNVAPFVSRQLIQRFTTSAPVPDYVQRVASTFDAGTYTLPDGTRVGDGRKGDLSATLAAILFDPDVRGETSLSDPQFGKIREPLLRFTHWARAFDADASKPEYGIELFDLSAPDALSQHPYRARSVFNFYRPGYVAPGTESGAAGLTVPELQIVNASSTPGYINFMTFWAFGGQSMIPADELESELQDMGVPVERAALERAFVPDYDDELALANDAALLVDHLDSLLVYDSLSEETKAAITATLEAQPVDGPSDTGALADRVSLAVMLVMTSPDYLVQR
ncbi:MAG: DUF1800 family protein [Pseudomonadota bacterium]